MSHSGPESVAAERKRPLDTPVTRGDSEPRMSPDEIQQLVEEATFDYTMGDNPAALEKLDRALAADPRCFEAWHAKCEIHFSERAFDDAREAAEKALEIRPDDVHIHTSLSRIHMEKGDKATAEKHGAQARMLGWKNELQNDASEGSEERP